MAMLRSFYGARGYAPAWTGSAEAADDMRAMLNVLAEADAEGLDAAAYRVAAPVDGASPVVAAEEDIRLTDAALRYANDLRNGRPDLRQVDDDVDLPSSYFDAASALALALQSGNLAGFLAGLEPQHPEYAQLKAALARYRTIAQDGGWAVLTSSAASAHHGSALLKRLADEDQTLSPDDGGNVANALKRYQNRHHLGATGRLDEATLASLNVPISQRMLEIIANMERWRWIPHGLESRYVMVNVPAEELVVMSDGAEVLSSHVVVGKPDWPTPILRADATGVTVNPPWLIPPHIARKEIFPKVAANPGYLRAHRMVYREGGGLEQLPGAHNALGTVKIDLPNRFNVYLHDTPSKKLFASADRDKSHGCVRVEEILPLASYALTGDADSVSSVTSAVARGRTEHLPLSEPLPIYILYWTAFVDADGNVEFRPDIYDRDQRLIAALVNGIRNQRVTSL